MVYAKQTLFLYILAAVSMNPLDASAAQNIDNPSIYDALVNGKSQSQMRLRYEYVDQQNKPKDANAFTLQTLLGWQTSNYLDTSITAQLINVSHLNQDFYDNSMGKSLPSQLPTIKIST
jgi:hypothetical protein